MNSKFGVWIPVKWRKPREEEKANKLDVLIDDEGAFAIADSELPIDGDRILVSLTSYSEYNAVDIVIFGNYGKGVTDDKGYDWETEVSAWMPLPKSYKERVWK